MPIKNLGSLVSGYLDPVGYNYETVVLQAGKPIVDQELNLVQDLGADQIAIQLGTPSGWLAPDALRVSDPTAAIFVTTTDYNALRIPNLRALVNGWLIPITHTNSNVGAGQTKNQLDLGAGPAGAGTRRTDIVILEVWRKLLAPTPSTDGKSPTNRIWLNGNVKLGATDDAALNLTEHMIDPSVGVETTKRVQIQFRLRVVRGVDIFTYPRGLDDPSVVANSVPTNAATPDGVVTTFPYVVDATDPGLWIAGDGDPANTLNTVDGYMYAIPCLGVFRRNTAAFAKDTNNNGGATKMGANPSDRPDGLYNNVIVDRDVVDLRMCVSPNGWNYAEVLEKNVNYLLDNTLKSEWMSTAPQGGGNDGHTVFWADEINVDTAGAELITDGYTDRSRRVFSDRSTLEVVTVAVPPPLGGWVDGATFSLDPTALAIHPYTAFNWSAYSPAAAVWLDIVAAQWIGPFGGPPKVSFEAKSHFQVVTNLGNSPAITSAVTLDSAVTVLGLTDETLYVDILVAYPAGSGLTMTPTKDFGANSIVVTNPAVLLPAPMNFNALAASNGFDYPHREVRIQYETTAVNSHYYADMTGISRSTRLPERASSVSAFVLNGTSYAVTLDSSGRVVTMANPLDPDIMPYDDIDITYVALRPMPQVSEEITVYYEARAPQALRKSTLGTTLTFVPRYISPKLYVITTGSGSQDESYPFPSAYVQTGGIFPSTSTGYDGDHELDGSAAVSIANFGANTGLLHLPIFSDYVPNPEDVTFLRDPTDADVEGRSFFKAVPSPGYVPNAYAQELSASKRHKVVLPMLVECGADLATAGLGCKGQLAVVLLIRWASFDAVNGFWFDSDQSANTTTACVFRTRGNLLNRETF